MFSLNKLNTLIYLQANQPVINFCPSRILLIVILQFSRVHVLENSLQYLFPMLPRNCVSCLHKTPVRSLIFVFLLQHLCELSLGILYETQSQHLPLYLLWKSNYLYSFALATNYLVPIILFVYLQLVE